ncbi:DUF1850 domain-containing protein [Streptomonospora nanhaiensis]|uniref:DUF1850 domain-containing protein n=1 Tax=Streptomonospora nanhaiensis TaxID=1323731 RepID=A0A853BLM0_9ACTN|nr:DUF1850 domain-containing protein [Streptomonospora nanhaiensis]NYI95466.1 hypothetical protein [Streptomonospora nanhaiensis]
MAAAPGAAAPGRRLRFVVTDMDAGRVVHAHPVAVGEHVVLRHTHSVSKRPVEEVFAVAPPGRLAMAEMRFDTFGANLPAGPERIGSVTTTFLRTDEGYRVLHHNRPLDRVQQMVGGPRVDHVLTFPDGRRLRLLDVVERGTRVEWSVQGAPGSWP